MQLYWEEKLTKQLLKDINKMKLVIDANIIFALLIKEGKTSSIFFNLLLDLYSPEFVLEEIEKHKNEILNKTKRSEEEFYKIFKLIKEIITIIPEKEIIDFINKAKQISPDIDDTIYFALALKLNCPIWSNDKKLKEQNKIKIYSTKEIINELNLF